MQGTRFRIGTRLRQGLLTGLALMGFPLGASAGTARIDPDHALVESFRGWGTSLCWWANVVGGLDNRDVFLDAIFGDLRLNIVRYNIGGGENPVAPNSPADPRARMQGFRPERTKWNSKADANQRLILREALRRGVTRVDAFSNSPPWWMTASGSVTGGLNPTADNLKAESEKEFAAYLVEAMAHLTKEDAVRFDTISPMNEPLSPWWLGNRQEGCHMSIEQQIRVLDHLHTALKDAGLTAGLVAPETFSAEEAIRAITTYPEATRQKLRAIATHGYDSKERAALLTKADKTPVWMSEYGDGDATGLQVARAILDDLNDLHAEEWVYWQAVEPDNGWGLLVNPLDGRSTQCERTQKFHVLRQFTNFIPPGSRVVPTHDADSVAAISPEDGTLAVVALNARDAEEPFSADVSAVAPKARAIRAIQTSPAGGFRELPAFSAQERKFEHTLPPRSVTTFVVPLR